MGLFVKLYSYMLRVDLGIRFDFLYFFIYGYLVC